MSVFPAKFQADPLKKPLTQSVSLNSHSSALQRQSKLSAQIADKNRLSRSTAKSSQRLLKASSILDTAAAKSPIFSAAQQVNTSSPSDFYRFAVNESGVFTAALTGLTGDADVRLVSDRNSNGAIDQGEVLAWQWERGTASESIRRFLQSGTYFLQVVSYNNQTANYSLKTNFTPATSDNRQFSIQLNYQQGLQDLTTATRDAIQKAAKFWEQVIPFSSFATTQNLVIDLFGTVRDDNILAYAGPDKNKLAADANQNLMPTTGFAVINTRFNQDYNQNPEYLQDILTHEFGHVLGIGTLWEDGKRMLVDRTSATYTANSYAGAAYGKLLGTSTPTAVPVETQFFGHWDETKFDQELMTPFAEAKGVATPLSELTIASLRDLGWNVNYGAAQPYALPGTAPAASTTLASSTASGSKASSKASPTKATPKLSGASAKLSLSQTGGRCNCAFCHSLHSTSAKLSSIG
jgi:hypothetical protein